MPQAINLKKIVKRFGPIPACQGVNLEVAEGEIHALVGENGAGKSTLMRILYGMIEPDAGEIRLWGNPVRFRNPHQAIQHGLGMVHQQLMLISEFSVWENIILGQETLLSRRAALKTIEGLAETVDLRAGLEDRVSRLSVDQRQKIELIKVLYRRAKIIILDEPTSMLALPEVARLFEVIRRLAQRGHTIIFISHKLGEVMNLAQRITVMRRGKDVAALPVAQTNAHDLARLMVGHELAPLAKPKSQPVKAEVLRVENLWGKDISFQINRGQIFGIAGVAGNGQEELAETLLGLRSPNRGRILLDGCDITQAGIYRRRQSGLAYIPPERETQAVIGKWSLQDNFLLGQQRCQDYQTNHIIKNEAVKQAARSAIQEFSIHPPDSSARIRQLSGGNQQKLVIARETGRPYKLLIACQPTQGLDIGASNFVYQRLLEDRANGRSILLISFELEELLSLADIIGVMCRGRLVYQAETDKANMAEISLWMSGAGQHAA